jgi:spore maturation protein A
MNIVNLIWMFLLAGGILFGFFAGNMKEVNEALFSSGQTAVTLCIGLVSVLVFWLGMMRIAEESGLLNRIGKWCLPMMKFLFPDIPPTHPAMGYIISNTMANVFGLGNAATPLGIKAMSEMKKLNNGKNEASRSMITFLALNTSSVTLIPTTILALRQNHHAQNPSDIIIPAFIATFCSCLFALAIDRYFYMRKKGKRGR